MKRDPKHLLYGLSAEETSMKGIWLLSLLYFGSLVSGAIISLIAYKITLHFLPEGPEFLAENPYPRFFDRARWLSVLLIFPYLFYQCRFANWQAIGFARPFRKTVAFWFLSGIAMIFIIYGFNTGIGAFAVRWNPSELLKKVDDAILAALLVSTLEELIFRGLVFRMFYSAMGPTAAIVASSLFFAVLHFKTPAFSLDGISPEEIGSREAAEIALRTAIAAVTEFDFKYLLAIFLVGVVLHQVFLLTENLWASIAIHAGWVFTIKLFGNAFYATERAGAFSGTTRVADGYWVSIVLFGFVTLFGYLLKRRNASHAPPTRATTAAE